MTALCPPNFVPITLNGGNTSCTPACPLPYYSDRQYDALAITANVLGICAMVSSFITLVPHFALPSRRQWPHLILPTLFSCIFVLGMHFVFPIAGYRYNWRHLVCDQRSHTYHTGKSNHLVCIRWRRNLRLCDRISFSVGSRRCLPYATYLSFQHRKLPEGRRWCE